MGEPRVGHGGALGVAQGGARGGVGWGKERVLGGRGGVGPGGPKGGGVIGGPGWGIRGPRVRQGLSGQGKWF